MANGLSCPETRGIFWDQGSTRVPCIGRWALKPLEDQGSPCVIFLQVCESREAGGPRLNLTGPWCQPGYLESGWLTWAGPGPGTAPL